MFCIFPGSTMRFLHFRLFSLVKLKLTLQIQVKFQIVIASALLIFWHVLSSKVVSHHTSTACCFFITYSCTRLFLVLRYCCVTLSRSHFCHTLAVLSLTHERWGSPGVFVALHNLLTFLLSDVAPNMYIMQVFHFYSLDLTTLILVISLLLSCMGKPKCLSKMASFASCVVGCINAYQVYASLSSVRLDCVCAMPLCKLYCFA